MEARGRFYEQLAVSYDLTFQNRLSNNIPASAINGGAIPLIGGSSEASIMPIGFSNISKLLRNSQTGMQHRFGISLGSYTLFKHINITPGVNYGQTWYFKSLEYEYVPTAQAVRADTTTGLRVLQTLSTNLNLGTTFYGTVVRSGTHKIQALRHKVT
ncbi:putative LPS assembly protein LptD, partial [Hymenobacter sp. AT01-02]|uniref:putative LPS assembly protein LptD n=1 Tax=Hymenobacter sp. AT01-02 TaxID=1571877 RepID=UPI001F3274F4